MYLAFSLILSVVAWFSLVFATFFLPWLSWLISSFTRTIHLNSNSYSSSSCDWVLFLCPVFIDLAVEFLREGHSGKLKREVVEGGASRQMHNHRCLVVCFFWFCFLLLLDDNNSNDLIVVVYCCCSSSCFLALLFIVDCIVFFVFSCGSNGSCFSPCSCCSCSCSCGANTLIDSW